MADAKINNPRASYIILPEARKNYTSINTAGFGGQ